MQDFINRLNQQRQAHAAHSTDTSTLSFLKWINAKRREFNALFDVATPYSPSVSDRFTAWLNEGKEGQLDLLDYINSVGVK